MLCACNQSDCEKRGSNEEIGRTPLVKQRTLRTLHHVSDSSLDKVPAFGFREIHTQPHGVKDDASSNHRQLVLSSQVILQATVRPIKYTPSHNKYL